MTATASADLPHTGSSTDLKSMLGQRASWEKIAAHLDALPTDERIRQVLAVTGSGVRELYEACAGAPPATLDDFVPADETGTVIFQGRNSMLLFTRFQKRFARREGRVIGYNHQPWSFVTGPGYFVVEPPSGTGPAPAEPYFDYTKKPPLPVPDGWPSYSPSGRGLSALVYGGMQDYMRRVARGVVVGKAFKGDASRGAYFSLSRR